MKCKAISSIAMKPYKWQKTRIIWDDLCGWKTNIPVDDLAGCGPHEIRGMVAISITDSDREEARTAVLTFSVIRGAIGPTTRKREILRKLRSLNNPKSDLYVHVSASRFGSDFKITFNLRRSFCDEVLEFMRSFFKVLGIKDEGGYYLSNFEIKTETLYRQGEGWIPFTSYFKLKKGLFQGDELPVELMPNADPLT